MKMLNQSSFKLMLTSIHKSNNYQQSNANLYAFPKSTQINPIK